MSAVVAEAWVSFVSTEYRTKVRFVISLSEAAAKFLYAPINVKPEGGWGGGSGNPREFDCDAYPQGGDFDLTSCI